MFSHLFFNLIDITEIARLLLAATSINGLKIAEKLVFWVMTEEAMESGNLGKH